MTTTIKNVTVGENKTLVKKVVVGPPARVTVAVPYLDSDLVLTIVDSDYIQARQITYDFLDSAQVVSLIDSDYVQARQNTLDCLDSAQVLELIDSDYITPIARAGLSGGIGVTYDSPTGIISIGQPVDSDADVQFNTVTSGSITFDSDATSTAERTLSWNPAADTLNLNHSNGVVQQIGQELYGYVRNNTGSTIVNGTVVRFDGAEQNGEARLEVAPMLADGTFPSLYTLGVATQDIDDGEDGRVAVWGKVRELDMSDFNIGDILYASPDSAGKFTNVKPTAPNNVIPVAAVVNNTSDAGEIFVRPTVEQKMSYGRFERTTDVTISQTNTAAVIDFDTVEISNGVTRVVGNTSRLQVDQSGLYQIDFSAQIDISGGGGPFTSGTMYVWIRKNGSDVTDSTRRQGVINAAPANTLSFGYVISLDANDYIEIAYAGDDTSLLFDASAATAFTPSTSAVKVGVTQVQL